MCTKPFVIWRVARFSTTSATCWVAGRTDILRQFVSTKKTSFTLIAGAGEFFLLGKYHDNDRITWTRLFCCQLWYKLNSNVHLNRRKCISAGYTCWCAQIPFCKVQCSKICFHYIGYQEAAMEVLDLMALHQLQDVHPWDILITKSKEKKRKCLNINGNSCFCSHDRHVGRSTHIAQMYKICVETLKHLQSHGRQMWFWTSISVVSSPAPRAVDVGLLKCRVENWGTLASLLTMTPLIELNQGFYWRDPTFSNLS